MAVVLADAAGTRPSARQRQQYRQRWWRRHQHRYTAVGRRHPAITGATGGARRSHRRRDRRIGNRRSGIAARAGRAARRRRPARRWRRRSRWSRRARRRTTTGTGGPPNGCDGESGSATPSPGTEPTRLKCEQRHDARDLPSRLWRIPAHRKRRGDGGSGVARRHGHHWSHHRRRLARVPAGPRGPGPARQRHCQVHELIEFAVLRHERTGIVESSRGGSDASQSSRHARCQ